MTEALVPRAADRLRRTLRTGGILVLTLAALSPAASVYVTGAAVLHIAGTGAAVAVLAGGAVMMVATLLYAELGAAFPHAGGIYHGIGAVLGRRAGAAAMVLALAAAPALLAFVALGLATYLRTLFPGLPRLAIADAALALAAALAMARVRTGVRFTGALLVLELAALALLTAAAWLHPARSLPAMIAHPLAWSPGHGLVPPGAVALVLGSLAAAYACSGSNLALNFAEEVRGRSSAIGRVVVLGGVLSGAAVALPLIGMAAPAPHLGADLAAEAPVAAIAHELLGADLARALAVGIALAILDHLAGATVAYSRLVYAVARSAAPRVAMLAPLTRLRPRTGAPAAAAAVLAVAAMLLTLAGERSLLLLLSGELVTPALVIGAVLVGRRRGQTGREGFRAPLHPLLPLLGMAIVAVCGGVDLLDPAARASIALLTSLAAIAACFPGERRPAAAISKPRSTRRPSSW